ncbi:MAG: hypothetical protein KAT04_12495, partial [Methylococcales bacterium]|nr:hypothetical protein [Methylococcales bacterium]
AGIIALGVATLMGLTIIHGEDLVMQRENWELARILIPSIVSVFGWLVTIWWALRQVEISSQRNRTLQHEMLQSNEKIKVVDSVILTYIELNKSLHKIQSCVNNLKTNIDFKSQGKSNPNLGDIFQDSGNAYSEMYENIEALKFNLARLSPYRIDVKESVRFIVRIRECFSGESIWYSYQEQAAEHLQDEENSYEELFTTIDTVSSNCTELCSSALSVVKKLNIPNKALNTDSAKNAAPVS